MRICFSIPMARPVFEPTVQGPFGGSEVRAYLFSTGLTRHSFDMNVVVEAHEPLNCRSIAGVRLWYRTLPPPIPRLRDEPRLTRRLACWPSRTVRRLGQSFRKRWATRPFGAIGFEALLAKVNADVYCCFGVHQHSASVIHTAAGLGRPSILFLASDTDLSPTYRNDSAQRNSYGQRADACFFALTKATHIVAQSKHQHGLLADRFGLSSTVIRNPVAALPVRSASAPHRLTTDVLWIGRADCFSKRADLAIQLARSCPMLRFTFIMNRRDPKVYGQLTQDIPPNVRLLAQVAWREIHEYFRSAKLLLNTSDAEGFPNAFLQAWQSGLPIVSLHADPDQLLSRHRCGTVTHGDLALTSKRLHELTSNAAQRDRLGRAGRRYVQQHHRAESCCDELAALIRRLTPPGVRRFAEVAA